MRRLNACELMHRVRGPLAGVVGVLLQAVPALAQEGEAHEASLTDLFWPVVNFAIMVWILNYFLREPLTTYLKNRSAAIRQDLVEAAALKATATAQLDEIERKMTALPGEIEALRTRGQAEIAGEEQRISQQAAAERDRLLDQARRQIDVQVRLAKRELTEHAADLAVHLAADRLATETTAADHDRLVSRYLEQVKR
jgi:F-type H+-transporting ATPase subunit b